MIACWKEALQFEFNINTSNVLWYTHTHIYTHPHPHPLFMHKRLPSLNIPCDLEAILYIPHIALVFYRTGLFTIPAVSGIRNQTRQWIKHKIARNNMSSLQAPRAAGTPWAIIDLNNCFLAKQRRGYVNLLKGLCPSSGESFTMKDALGKDKELWLEKRKSRQLQSELKECILYIHQPQFQCNDARRDDNLAYPLVFPIKTLVEYLMVSMTEFSLEGTGCFQRPVAPGSLVFVSV